MSAVHRLAYNGDIVAIKMGRRQGARRAHIWIDTQPTSNAAAGPFSSQPSGPRPVGCFSALLTPYVSDLDMLVARALKNSQLTRGDVIIICETVH
jgi:hypothetical protein